MLGGGPGDENQPPGPDDLQPNFFEFFGFGQPGNGPAAANHQQQNNQAQVQQAHNADAAEGWGQWPDNQHQAQNPLPGEPFLEVNDIMPNGNVAGADIAGDNIDFDLNEPPPEDLGGIEDLVQIGPQPLQDQLDVAMEEQIIDDGLSSSEELGQPLEALDQNNVEVFIPMENGAPIQFIPDEIHENELLDGQDDHNMQIGLVQVFHQQVPIPPKYLSPFPPLQKQNADSIRAWAKYLAPGLGAPFVAIPRNWADFFTAMLLNPGSFEWAKSFLSSQAWAHFQNSLQEEVHFTLPDNCPSKATLECLGDLPSENSLLANLEEEIANDQMMTAPAEDALDKGKEKLPSPSTPDEAGPSFAHPSGPWSKAYLAQAISTKAKKDAVVDSDLRRSERKKRQQKGFKDHGCPHNGCFGCNINPPTVSPSIIRNLGATFCKIDPTNLTDAALAKKRKQAAPGGKRPVIQKKPKSSDEDKNNKKPGKKQQKK
ncbi:unnamed protein product [Urochloa humidicola]